MTIENLVFKNFNKKTAIGGAIYAEASKIIVENSSASFFGNSTDDNGTHDNYNAGAIGLYYGSTAVFKNSNVNFTSNTAAGNAGAISVHYGSNMTVEDSNLFFFGNGAKTGGAIYLNEHSSFILKDSNIDFTKNEGFTFPLNEYSSLIFKNSNIKFTDNVGGAIMAGNNSNIAVENSSLLLSGNIAGISLYYRSTAVFKNSNIKITDTIEDAFGGIAFFITEDSNAYFIGSTVAFTNTRGQSASAVYNNSNLTFENSSLLFSGNSADSGGASYLFNNSSLIFKNSDIIFASNTAMLSRYDEGGGAIRINKNSNITMENSTVFFSGNSTDIKGGAIHANSDSKIIIENSTVFFSGNSAGVYGGAIYAENKAVNTDTAILSVSGGDVIFKGNTANGKPNDIYLGENINFELRIGSDSAVSMDGGIKGVKESAFTKTGLGKIELLNNSINEHYGEFNIKQGIVESGASAKTVFGKLNIEADGIYSLINNDASQTTDVGEAKIEGKMEIDVDFNNQRADMLKAALNVTPGASGDVYLGNASKLKLNIYGAGIGERKITIIETQGGVSGRFSNDPFEDLGYKRKVGSNNPALVYTGDSVYITMIQGSDFEKKFGKMTHNQREVARSADRITAAMTPGATVRKEFLDTLNKINQMSKDEDKKRGLDELSGSIIANMLSAGAYGYGNEEILERIRPKMNYENDEISKRVWGQGYTYGRDIDKDENSVEQFKINGYGAEAGADLFTGENSIGGVYAGYERSDGKQEKSKGETEAVGAGLYGGWFGENWNVKGRVYGGKLQYKINRALDLLGEKTKSEIEAYNVKGDILAQYNIWMGEKLSIAPYGHIIGGYVRNSKSREEGRGGANIEIYDGSYGRLEGRLGLGINYAIGRFNLYGKVSAGYVALGERAEYKGEFIDTGEEMEIWGATGGKVTAGTAIGAEYEITNNWSVYANGSGNYYEGGKGYYGNIGVNYSFNAGKKKRTYEIKPIPEEEKAEEISEEKSEQAKDRRDREMIKKYNLNAATFKLNKFDLSEKARETIERQAKEIKKSDYNKIAVKGHTDTTGSKSFNDRLSRQRAQSVYNELLLHGIPAEKMSYDGYGDQVPIFPNTTREGRAANRRAEIYVE
jgi:predicted outer membrane repeat protein